MRLITIGGRNVPLFFSLWEMKQIQEEVGFINEINEKLAKHVGSSEQIETLVKLIRILGNAGLEEAGQAADLTDKWVGRRLTIGSILAMTEDIILCINDGMQMENDIAEAEDPDKAKDLGLEELRRK